MAGEAAAERDQLILAARGAEIESPLGDPPIDEHRVRADHRPRRGVVDVLDGSGKGCGHAGSLYRLPPNHPDEEENDCHNKENVQPSAERGGRNHSQQPEHNEQDHEEHQHRHFPRPAWRPRPATGCALRIIAGCSSPPAPWRPRPATRLWASQYRPNARA